MNIIIMPTTAHVEMGEKNLRFNTVSLYGNSCSFVKVMDFTIQFSVLETAKHKIRREGQRLKITEGLNSYYPSLCVGFVCEIALTVFDTSL